MRHIELGQIITPAKPRRAGEINFPVLSMTMRNGLVNQADKFKKRIASADTSQYKVVGRSQLVVGFPIDEGVLAFQNLYDEAIVSPAYNIWNLQNDALIDSKYLEQFLRSPRALAFYKSKLRSTTARRRSLPNDVFLSLSVPVPSLAEQERIMKLLDEADELRKLRAQADRSTAALIPALFHEMFGDPMSNSKGWKISRFVDVCTKPPNNGIFKKADEYGNGTPVVWVEQLYSGLQIDIRNCRRLRASENDISNFGLLHGDVLFCRSSLVREGIGQTAYYDGENGAVLFECHVIRFSPNHSIVLPEYVTAFFRHPHGKAEIMRVAKTATMTTIGQKDIAAINIPIPPLTLQQEFAQRVAEIRELEAAQAASRQRVEHLFQSMLHRAFNQEL